MGNCLITKLKESVDNANLPIFNALRINVNHSKADSIAQSDRYITLRGNAANSVIVKNVGGYFCDSSGENLQSEVTVGSSNAAPFYTAETDQIIICNKENLVFLSLYTSSDNIDTLNIEFEDFKYLPSLEYASMGGNSQNGFLTDIIECPSLTTLNINSTNIKGDIAALKDLNLTGTMLYSSGIYGDVESLIYKSDGTLRPAGTLQLMPYANKIKLNGSYLPSNAYSNIVFDGHGGVSLG